MIMHNNFSLPGISVDSLGRTLIRWLLAYLLLGSVYAIFANAAYAQAPIKIMPLGDSITYDDRVGDTRTSGEVTGYRQPLWQLLNSGGYYVDFIGSVIAGQDVLPAFDPDNDGYPGTRDDQIALMVYELLTESMPDVVLLHIGTNEVDQSELDVETILDEIDRYEIDNGTTVKVFLARIINRRPYDVTTTKFNDNVEAMAQLRIAAGDDIVIVDMEDGASLDYRLEPQGDMADQWHPNGDGYVKIANKWMEALTSYLSIPGDSVPPVINTVPFLTTAYVGEQYAYNLVASGSPLLSYELTDGPTGMTIDPTTGRIEWTPTLVGVAPVTVTVSNGVSPNAAQVFDLTVELSTSVPVLNSGEAQSGAVAQGEWQYYSITTTADDKELVVELSNMSSDVDLYVLNGAEPTLGTYDCRPYVGQTNPETCTLPNTGATTWYIGVQGYTAGSFTIKATGAGTTILSSGVSQAGSVAQGEWDYYVINATAANSQIVVEMTNLSGDIDLYVRQGSKPTASLFDCRPYLDQPNAEICTLPNTGDTTWHIGLHGYQAGSYTVKATLLTNGTNLPPVLTSIGTQSVKEGQQLTIPINASDPDGPAPLLLNASNAPANATFIDNGDGTGLFSWTPVIGEASGNPYTVTFVATDDGGAGLTDAEIVTINVTPAGGGGGAIILNSGEAQSGTVAQGEWQYYSITTTADDTELVVELSNMSSDVDLYVFNGAEPTLSLYDCRPYIGGANPETCTLPNTGATTWYIGVQGYTAGSFTIKATGVGTTILSSGVSQAGSVAQGEWDYYVINATAANSQIVVEMTNLSGDIDLYVRQGSKPTASLFDCRPYLDQPNAEICTLPSTGDTTWHIGLQGYQAGSYTVSAILQ